MSNEYSRRSFLGNAAAAGAVGTLGVAGSSVSASSQTSSRIPLPSSAMTKAGNRYINPRKVLLWENTRKEVREALSSGSLKAAIIPTGSTEQHGEHLALVCDVANATLIAQQTALELYPQAIVSTPCPLGYAPYHMARKGTITLRKETFLAYVSDVIESLKAHGIRTILVVNGHGGNHRLLREALPGWRREFGITLDADSYWNGIPREESSEILETGAIPSHAAEFETSLFLAAFPERVRSFTMEEYDKAGLNYESGLSPEVQEYLAPFGTQGANQSDRSRQELALLATAEKGEALIAIATRFFAGKLQKMIAATEAGTPWPPG